MNINTDLVNLIVTVVFSFLVGLEVKTYRIQFHGDSAKYFFGSARTFTFVGLIGYIFYKIDIIMYLAILIGLTLLYALFYYQKLLNHKQSILLYLVMLIVYSLGPLSVKFPIWMISLIFVLVVFVLNAKKSIHKITTDFNPYEFEILSKMLLLSAVILPLLPNKDVIPYIPISPFKIWLAVVVVSGISYGGYIAQKYFFPHKGYFLTGIIGGIYSSTATTVVLSRKAKKTGRNPVIEGAIIVATSIMYIRLIVVAAIFNFEIAKSIALPFAIFSLIGIVVSLFFLYSKKNRDESHDIIDANPLELGTAFIFAALFIVMMLLTQYITNEFGSMGLKIFSFIAGFTDIDPFVLSLLTGKFSVSFKEIVVAVMVAAGSNNLLKATYALWFGGWRNTLKSALWVALLGVFTITWALML
ncbi:MAG: DUF4010 domain-containing protein [Epsilonproteobacteria bacterium]|nr:DUF4010 domain-containing protein [Campylobacterota bacterium]